MSGWNSEMSLGDILPWTSSFMFWARGTYRGSETGVALEMAFGREF